MKTPPRPGERYITHITEETGDTRSFGINAANYKPSAIWQTAMMEHAAVCGYRLDVTRAELPLMFTVVREDGTRLTLNSVESTGDQITLRTSILRPMLTKEAYMVADLEQCAALALLKITP
jgi:hypothetical protein